MSTLLVTHEGTPVPPQDVERRLREFDPRYGLRFLPHMEGWVLSRTWRENDSRREMIRKGEMTPDSDWDILAVLPKDCKAEDAVGYLQRQPKYAGDREIEALCDALLVANAATEQANMDVGTQRTDEWLEIRGHKLTDTPRVFNAGIPDAPKKRKKK